MQNKVLHPFRSEFVSSVMTALYKPSASKTPISSAVEHCIN